MSAGGGLVDSHCHVAEPEFDADRADVLARAAAAGVTELICVGATGAVERNLPSVALAGTTDPVRVYATVGVHPHDAATAGDDAFAQLAAWAALEHVVALGETGLDYHYDHSPRPVQRAVFARTIALARQLDLPLVVHVREAHAEAADLLRVEGRGDVPTAIHCFTGDPSDARRYLDLGCVLSVAGVVTFKNASALRDAARVIPADRLMVETDSPYLAPAPHRGKRNEPGHVRTVAEALAGIRGVAFEDLAATTARTARSFFRLPPLRPEE